MSEVNEVLENEKTFDDFLKLIKSDHSLPKKIEPLLLERYFKVCEKKPEVALELYKSNLKLRQKGPQIFLNRDVLSDQIQNISKIIQFCPLPKLTDDNRRILLIRYTTSDMANYSCVDVIKMLLAMLDVRYILPDSNGKLADDDVLIIDLEKYCFKHFLDAAKNFKSILLYFKYSQETVPIPTRSAHILNSSWVVDRFMSMIRPLLRKEVAECFQFHSGSFENLHKSVPKEVLPEEYGGLMGPMDDLHRDWMESFESKREYLLNDNNWKITD